MPPSTATHFVPFGQSGSLPHGRVHIPFPKSAKSVHRFAQSESLLQVAPTS